MYRNPLVRLLLMLLGAWFLLRFCAGVWPPLAGVVTGIALLYAASLWVLRWERPLACSIHQRHGWARAPLAFIARTGKVPYPCSDAGQDSRSSPVLLNTASDLHRAQAALNREVVGYRAIVDPVLQSLFDTLKFREQAPPQAFPPLGVFLFIGPEGLGKQYLAKRTMSQLYDGGPYLSLDVDDYGRGDQQLRDDITTLISRNPKVGIIVENADRASDSFKQWLLKLYREADLSDPHSGKQVRLDGVVLFLLVHLEGKRLDNYAMDTTVQVDRLADASKLPAEVIWFLQVHLFQMPVQDDWLDIVANAMSDECRRHGLDLGRVDPAVMAREVAAVAKQGNFKMLPGRIHRRLATPIKRALTRQASQVDVSE